MLDEYLALGGVELGNNARAYDYASCLSCCVGVLKLPGCEGLHDATGPWVDAVRLWAETGRNLIPDPRGITPATTWANQGGGTPATDPDYGVTWTLTNVSHQIGPKVALPEFADASVSVVVESSVNMSTVLVYRPGGPSSTTGQRVVAFLNLVAGVPETVTGTINTDGTPLSNAGLYLAADSGVVGAVVSMTRPIAVSGTVVPSYFDGDFPDSASVDYTWAGAVNNSVSIRLENTTTEPAQSLAPPYNCANIQNAPWYDPDRPESADFAGFYILSISGITDDTLTAGVTEGIEDGGVVDAGRYAARSVRVKTMLVGCGSLATEYGLAWLKAALGRSFCGRHGTGCGTSDLEFFIDCPPAITSTEEDYGSATAKYRRYLHGVGTTSGVVKVEEWESQSGAWVTVVEYILTAESPFVWGETIPIQMTGAVLTAFDDIPFNLMRYPSGEVGDGVPAVVATQYAQNGSVEYGATGWGHVTDIGSGVTAGQSTDIAAVGPNSYRARLLATGAVTNGVLAVYHDISLSGMPAGSKPSISAWGAALIFAGSPSLDGTLIADVEWRDGSNNLLGTTGVGSFPLNGGNASANGLVVPGGATQARVRVRAININATAGVDLRLYGDAFSLTVP